MSAYSEAAKQQEAVATLRFAMMDAMAQCSHIHRMSPDAAALVVEEVLGTILSEKYRWVWSAIEPKRGGAA